MDAKRILKIVSFFATATLTACGGGGGGGSTPTSASSSSYTVTAQAGPGGTITPTSQAVTSGGTTTFTVQPDTAGGYAIGSVTGCNGTLAGNTYTTGTITAACTVTASFAQASTIQTYTISGNVSGLSGSGLVLQDNSGDDLPVSANGAFTFATPASGYSVTVKSQPSNPTQVCTVANGSGTAVSNVTTVQVGCATAISGNVIGVSASPSAGGTVTGGGTYGTGVQVTVKATNNTGYSFVDWTENGTEVSTNASYAFTADASHSLVANFKPNSYMVSAATATNGSLSPSPQTVSYGATATFNINATTGYVISSVTDDCGGTGTLSGGTYTTAAITTNCTVTPTFVRQTFTIGVSASPTAGGTVTGGGTYDAGAPVTVNAYSNTGYAFVDWKENGTEVSTSANYGFTADASHTLVANFLPTYTVTAATATGGSLSPSSVGVTYGGRANFYVSLTQGYALSGVTDDCGNTGNLFKDAVSGNTYYTTGTITKDCTVTPVFAPPQTIGGTVTGLTGSGLVLQDNGGDDLPVSANGAFTFATKTANYSVTVKTQPSSPAQFCSVTGGTGIATATVSSVQVTCVAAYTVGGQVSGLNAGRNGTGANGNNFVVLQDNYGDDLTLTSNGTFAFTAALPQGKTYSVTVKTQPAYPPQTCTVTNGSGTMPGANVSSVAIVCSPWARQVGAVDYTGGKTDTKGTSVAVDANGNIFTTGYAAGGTSIDGQPYFGLGYFLEKYDAKGSRVYTITDSVTSNFVWSVAVATNTTGSVYVAGYTTSSSLDGQSNPAYNSTYQFGAAFVTKYDSTGARKYTKLLGGSNGSTSASGVATDANDNVYVVGSTGVPLVGTTKIGTGDYFLAKYNNTGTLSYIKENGVSGVNTVATAVTTDSSGNVYVAGWTKGGLDGNSLTGTTDFFVSKFASDGTRQFTKQLGVSGAATTASAVAVDANGNIFVAGSTYGSLDGNTYSGSGFANVFLTKYNSSGVKQFTKEMGSKTDAYALALDSSGNAFITGYTAASIDGNWGCGTENSILTKYDNSGNYMYTKVGCAADGAYGYVRDTFGTSLATDANGNVFMVGYTDGSVAQNVSVGADDYFLLKFDTDGNLK